MININRNTNVYSNIHASEISFLFRGNLTIQFNYEPNEQTVFFFQNSYFKEERYLEERNHKIA